MKSLKLTSGGQKYYNLRLSHHIFLEILALFRCNTWFETPCPPPTSTPWSPSCPCPPSPCSSRWWWVRAKSLPVQTFLSGGRVFNKVFQSQESIDQYVAFLLLINPQLWRKWRYNSGFKSSVRSKSDLKSHQLLVIIVHRRGKKIYMCGLLIRKNKWSCVEEK